MFDDTIAAIATPLGEGGLAVIRISGPAALAVAAVLVGQITAKPLAAWLSMGYSAGAFICTVTAVAIRRRR